MTNQPTTHRIVFFGSPEFAVPSLRALVSAGLAPVAVVTQPAKPVGRHAAPRPSEIAVAANELNLPLVEPVSIKKPEFAEWLKAQKPDVAVLVAYGKILPESVLKIPRLGFINVHPSLLPKHRGASPITGAILAGDKETGVTIMQLDAEMDHGPILTQETTPIPPGTTMGHLSTTLAEQGAVLLVKTLRDYLAGTSKPTPQDHTQATFTKILSRADGELDWHKSVQEIDCMIRAFDPWPGTFTCLGNKRLKVLAAAPANDSGTHARGNKVPGAVEVQGDRLFIRARDGMLEITRVQLEGKKVQSAAEFIRGQRDLRGATVGPCLPQK